MNLETLIIGLVVLSVSAQGAITFVSVDRESQDQTGSYLASANLWTVSAPPYPLPTEAGIGRLLNTSGLDADIASQTFILHGHRYDAPFVPVASSMVTYGFDAPMVVGELEVIQHMNGISKIEGFVGDSPEAMTSVGTAFSQRGDVSGGAPFSEGEQSVFTFTNRRPALFFRFVILKTRLSDGYAAYRAFPRKPSDSRIEPAVAVVSKPSAPTANNWLFGVSVASLLMLLGILVLLWRDRRRQIAQGTHADDA